MKLGFLGIVLVFLTTVVYVTWHLWRLTPINWLTDAMYEKSYRTDDCH